MKLSLARIVLLAAGLTLAATAGRFAQAELAHLAAQKAAVASGEAAGDARQWRFAEVRALPSQLDQMLFCLNTQKTLAFARAPAARRQSLTRACLARADAILSRAPSRSVSHLVRADALLRLGDVAPSAAALERAQQTGAREGWMAVGRLRTALTLLATAVPPQLTPPARVRIERLARRDLALLAATPALGTQLAMLYFRNTRDQAWIAEVIETRPEADQRNFLRALQDFIAARARS